MQTISMTRTAHKLLLEKLAAADCIVVDATAGNGSDTLFLAQHAAAGAEIFAFDIQQAAINTAEALLKKNNLAGRVKFIHDSHANLGKYLTAGADVVMFNLGYLPGADHQVTTLTETTLAAVDWSVRNLKVGGLLTIAAYRGHCEGMKEYVRLQEYLAQLPDKEYAAACYTMINHVQTAPVLFVVEKVRR